jgi:hypothetical protein
MEAEKGLQQREVTPSISTSVVVLGTIFLLSILKLLVRAKIPLSSSSSSGSTLLGFREFRADLLRSSTSSKPAGTILLRIIVIPDIRRMIIRVEMSWWYRPGRQALGKA